MSFQTSLEAGVAEIVLDHPPVNALDSRGWLRLAETVAALGREPKVRAVLVSAAGRGFCAGVDIKELAADASAITAVNRGCYETFAAVYECPVPVISAVHGFCLGGGIGIGADTVLGPVLLGYGFAEGGPPRGYFSIGSTF